MQADLIVSIKIETVAARCVSSSLMDVGEIVVLDVAVEGVLNGEEPASGFVGLGLAI